jgi:hypothetical protein
MSMDRDYQTKDPRYDTVNRYMVAGIALLAAVITGLWFYLVAF